MSSCFDRLLPLLLLLLLLLLLPEAVRLYRKGSNIYTSWPAAETSHITFHGFHLGPYAENTSKMKHHEGWCGECACCKAHAHDVVGKSQIPNIRPSTIQLRVG